jgi:hypothetical protein
LQQAIHYCRNTPGQATRQAFLREPGHFIHVQAGVFNPMFLDRMNIVTRIMGIVLTVIAFQMLTAGLKTLLPGLA